MILIWLTLFLSTTSLASPIDALVSEFDQEFGVDSRKMTDIVIAPSTMKVDGRDSYGECWYAYFPRRNSVKLSAHWWPTASADDRKKVLFHELGHCVLGLPHGTGIMDQRLRDRYDWPALIKDMHGQRNAL